MFDVAIIGAGAIGLYAAKLLEKHDVVVLDKAKEIGGHTCSGLYSANLAKFLNIRKEWVEHKVRGAMLHSPGGIGLELKKPGTAAYVINRDLMEKGLAEDVGENVRLGVEVMDFKASGKVAIRTSQGIIESKMMIACDGSTSIVGKRLGCRPGELLNGLIALVDEECADSHVDLWFDKAVAKDGFLWKIPRGGRTEYGMMATAAKFPQLERFFGLKDYEKHFGFISIGPPGRTAFDRAIIMGNAAGIVKPWSGGGIIYGMQSAQIARDVIGEAVRGNDFGADVLGRFDVEWRGKIGKSISMGMMFREFYKSASNSDIDSFFSLLQSGGLDSLDMDFPALDLG
ncbi:MAG: FAD-dependent monooxygenase [Candidatus Aenigmarchaeota archaeon]|nr:FAD-dependent monooxygenase [Candidatus Aenigmarchaeota archaeon]